MDNTTTIPDQNKVADILYEDDKQKKLFDLVVNMPGHDWADTYTNLDKHIEFFQNMLDYATGKAKDMIEKKVLKILLDIGKYKAMEDADFYRKHMTGIRN